MDINYSQFTNMHVRNLAWIIASPCLINHPLTPQANFFEDEYAGLLLHLKQLDSAPQELLDFLQKTKRKALGNYFEDLIEFWLQHRKNTKILARNLQIIDGKKTIGECDFIVEMNGKITHIEVAIKYYLATQNSTDAKFWVGRGLTDRLDLKLDKLFSHQLKLSGSAAMQDALQHNHIKPIEHKIAIFKGYFFKYFFSDSHSFPQDTAAEVANAYWCKIDELAALPASFLQWQILTKPHWLTHDDEWFERAELKEKVETYYAEIKETPVLCNVLVNKKPTKFFISPSLWTL